LLGNKTKKAIMTIQFNADNNLTIHEEFRDKLKDQLSDELNRFSEHITRLEVHFSDQNGNKEGQNDKRCMLEARVEGRKRIVVQVIQPIMNLLLMLRWRS
jgi:hypothetical protein